jgi:glycosyltransferase involved in cell wall biosynthesis
MGVSLMPPARRRALPLRGPPIRVRVVYQTDPLAVVAGGIDTFIRGMLRHAPDDFRMEVVGLTDDPLARPVGRWANVTLGAREVGFLPVGVLGDTRHRGRIPLSVRLAAGVMRYRVACTRDADVFDFHRADAALPLLGVDAVRHCFIHQNMASLKDRNADIRWAAAPGLYFRLEAFALNRMDRVWCVREDAALAYRERFPERAQRFAFLPTWTDPDTFHPGADRTLERREAFDPDWGLHASDTVAIAVGRLDRQKNPSLMVEAFARASASRPQLRLLLVGDGVLRADLERQIAQAGLGGKVVLGGLQPPQRIARLLRAADLYLMSSAYEGMPISVLEALASGLPVVSTDVGEVRRVVRPGVSGELVGTDDAAALAAAIGRCLDDRAAYSSERCVASAAPFTPDKVLGTVFEAYREDVVRRGIRV